MTFAATYNNVLFVDPTDWFVGETNAGGGFAFQANVFVYKGVDGLFHYGADTLNTMAKQAASAVAITGGSATLSPLNIATANFQFGVAGGDPYITFDAGNDFFQYIRSTNTFDYEIGGSSIVQITSAALRPGSDNARSLGLSGARWSVVYAATGTINTSDEREKEQIGEIPAKWLDAWGDVRWGRFKFREAVAEKGDAARWHVGLVAQAVRDAFAARDLDALEIGLLCFDRWDQEVEEVTGQIEAEEPYVEYEKIGEGPDGMPLFGPVDKVRTVITREPTGETRVAVAAGDRWGLRMDECFAMEAAYQRRRLDRIEAKIAALGGGD